MRQTQKRRGAARVKTRGARRRRRAACIACITAAAALLTGLFLMYGPFPYFRELWVTTAMSTFHHRWLATSFFSDDTIAAILESNKTVVPGAQSDPSKIHVTAAAPPDNARELPEKPSDGERVIGGVGFTRLKTLTYAGWVVRVFDPSRVSLGVSKGYGASGEKVSRMVAQKGALAGFNAGGFANASGAGSGGVADGLLIAQGRLYAGLGAGAQHSILGFDKEGRLCLRTVTGGDAQALLSVYRDAVEFAPFLIVDGVPSKIEGNGGYGIQPRTAVGQTRDGTVIFVQIDGRSAASIGATVRDVQDVFVRYGAENAANLDGGASSVFVFRGALQSRPSSGATGERFVPDAFLIAGQS